MKTAFYAWTFVLLSATHWPRPDIDLSPYGGDKTVHLAAYGLWGMLACAAYVRSRRDLIRWLAAGVILSILDESTQPLFGRHAELLDGLADAAGLVLGFLAALLFQRLRPG